MDNSHLLPAVNEPLLHGRDTLFFLDALLDAGDLGGGFVSGWYSRLLGCVGLGKVHWFGRDGRVMGMV